MSEAGRKPKLMVFSRSGSNFFHYRLMTLLENIRQSGMDSGMVDRIASGPTAMMQTGITQAREIDDPPGLHEKTEYLLREWVQLYHSPKSGRDSTKAFSDFVSLVG